MCEITSRVSQLSADLHNNKIYIRRMCESEVKGPGKFEGEEPWAFYFYQLSLESFYDDIKNTEQSNTIFVYHITGIHAALWPELAGATVYLSETDSGFVHAWIKEDE